MDAKSTLCTACGMCCDGNLFAFVAVSSDEARTLRDAGLDLVEVAGRARLPQRCGALDGCRCRVYDQRPFGCRKFDCLLARSLTEKELPLEEALAVVAEAKEKLGRLDRLLSPAREGQPSGPVRRAAMLHQSGERVSASARAAFEDTEEFLRRHFVPD